MIMVTGVTTYQSYPEKISEKAAAAGQCDGVVKSIRYFAAQPLLHFISLFRYGVHAL
jgi:hypothetical protein